MAGFVEKLFDRTVPGLTKALDLTAKRNEAISSNIANAETPKYRAVDVDFAAELDRAFDASQSNVARTNTGHMDVSGADGQSKLVSDLSMPTKADGNNVDLDIQMGRLAYNSGKYSLAAGLLRQKLAYIKNVIREGGR